MSTMQDDDFFNWQGKLVNKVVVNAVPWNIPAGKVTALTTRRASYEPLYHKAQEKDERTKADVDRHRQARKTYEGELRVFVNAHIRYNEDVPRDEKIAMGVPPRDLEPTPRGKINDVPYVKLTAMGGADIRVRVTIEEDKTMSSMHPLADEVECKYTFVPSGELPPEDTDAAGLKTQGSKKARFIIACGVKNAGQSFWGFFRWVNKSNPQNSGQWTTKPLGVVIA